MKRNMNARSLSNLKPRTPIGNKSGLKVYLPLNVKQWLKENNASNKITVLFEVSLKLKVLFFKICHEHSGYRANSFTKGLQDLKEIAQLLEEIE